MSGKSAKKRRGQQEREVKNNFLGQEPLQPWAPEAFAQAVPLPLLALVPVEILVALVATQRHCSAGQEHAARQKE